MELFIFLLVQTHAHTFIASAFKVFKSLQTEISALPLNTICKRVWGRTWLLPAHRLPFAWLEFQGHHRDKDLSLHFWAILL